VPDTVTNGPITWEMVTGLQGTVITISSVLTDITPFTYTSYYSDTTTPSVTQCTGDAWEYGTSGIWITNGIPGTDPLLGYANHLTAVRVDYYDAPGQTVATAALRGLQAVTPLQVSVATYQGDADCDGMADAWSFPTSAISTQTATRIQTVTVFPIAPSTSPAPTPRTVRARRG